MTKLLFTFMIFLGGIEVDLSRDLAGFAAGATLAILGIALLFIDLLVEEQLAPAPLEETDELSTLAFEWANQRAVCEDLIQQRIELGQAHARINREVAELEELLIHKFPNTLVAFGDNGLVEVGNAKTPITRRVRIVATK